ncbi:MAG TPA: hypothetical protein VMR74_05465 [Gammaproteobacteria bacterium]|nr:hypothetical protein [Gammaproteobacteria bacterium]
MAKSSVRRQVLVRNPDNLAIWVSIDKGADLGSHAEKRSLLNAEIQSVCNDHISTLDDTLHRKSPRPNPTPHVFIEHGNELSQILWLKWED